MNRLILVLLSCLISLSLNAKLLENIVVYDSLSPTLVGKRIAVYLPESEVGFNDARKAVYHPLVKDVPNLDIQKNSVWLRFKVQNKSHASALVLHIDNSTLDEAELFWFDPSKNAPDSILITKSVPISERRQQSSEFLFRIDLKDTVLVEYFLRIKSEQPLILPISVSRPYEFMKVIVKKNWLNGMYFGLILVMACYNFFLFISTKRSSYFYYVIFIVTAGITQLMLKGIALQYFWPKYPFFELYGLVLFASISGIFGLLFTRKFLNLKQDFRILNKLVLVSILPFLVSLICVPFNREIAFLFMRNSTFVGALITLVASVIVYRKTKQMAHFFFLMAWSVLILGSVIYLLFNYGILSYNTFTNYAVQLASAIEMTLLSLALASHINILEEEKEESRKTTLRLIRENALMVEQQNVILEEQVTKRTEELVQKNEILNQTYMDLKEAQSKLVVAEKMSSLGQLTAGIAHEINNPINFVASNVNPLRRDINELLELLQKMEEIIGQEGSKDEHLKKIAAYKEDIDFDYLKSEIEFLLKGIQEGAGRTADIVKGLRVFSRVDEAEFKTADINDGLKSTLVIVNNMLNDISVIVDCRPVPPVLCFPGKLNQVFLNIITNAVSAIRTKFGSENGGELRVKTYQDEDGKICVSISDNGIGMDEATLTKVYEPFFTTKDVGEGMGLGMSIVFSIIKEHNAVIDVTSKPNEGTTFVVKLSDIPVCN
jgi:signal transduction histidine kinase